MPTFEELRERAIDLKLSGDEEGAQKLADHARAVRDYDALKEQAIDLKLSGDDEGAERIAKQAKDTLAPFQESRFTDIGRGLVAAPITIAQGISEMAAVGTDLAFGTEYSRSVSDAFEGFKKEYDLDPRTSAGNITEELLAFGLGFIPIAGWLGRASTVAKGGKIVAAPAKSKFFKSAEKFGGTDLGKALVGSRARMIGSTALATMGYETLVTPDGRPTMSDSFDFMPDALKTTDTSQMSGAELAYNRLSNKFKRGVEGGLASLTFDVGLPVAGATIRGIGTVPGVSEVSSGLARGAQKAFSVGTELLSRAPGVKPTATKLKEWFSPTALADATVMEEAFDVKAVRDTAEREAFQYYKDFEKNIGEFMNIVKVPKMRKKTRQTIKNKLYDFLTTGNEAALDGFNETAKTSARRMLRLDQEFQDKMIFELEQQVGDATGGPLRDALTTIKQNREQVGAYLRRRFDMYDDASKYYSELDFNSPQFTAAAQEMREFVRNVFDVAPRQVDAERPREFVQYKKQFEEQFDELFGSGRFRQGVTEEDLNEFARRKLLKYIGLDLSEGRLSPEAALREKRAALKQNNEVIMPGRVVSLVDNMLIERVPELNKLPATRELMGEIVDPQKAFINTISDMAQTTAGLTFYRRMADEFAVPASQGYKDLLQGKRPAIIRGPEMEENFIENSGLVGRTGAEAELSAADLFSNSGYTKLEAGEGESFFGPYANLTGMYVTPEVKQALTTPARMGMDELGQAIAAGALLKGQAQRMTIVPNLLSQVRNITGNGIALAQNGNLKRDSDFVDTFRLIAANIESMDDAGLRKYARELGALGVMDTSLVTSALRDFKEMAADFKFTGKLQKLADDATYTMVPFMQQLERLYSDSDSYFKLMSVFAEQSKITNALGKANLDINALPEGALAAIQKSFIDQGIAKRGASISLDQSPANFLLTMAGDTVKDTMPVYNRVGKAIRRLDAIPVFGNFTSFASENIRNSANTLSRGINELAFKADDALRAAIGDDAAQILERQIRGIGAQRLGSYVAVSSVMPAAITKASMLATGTTDTEMNAAQTLAADFYDGHAMLVIDNDKRGKITLGDQSYIFPHAFVLDPARAALRTYYEQGELGKDQASRILNSAWSGVKGYSEPFLSESLLYERVRDVLPQEWIGRGGETQTGSRVYDPQESFGDKVSKSVTHIMGTYIPGYGRMFVEERGGKLQAGRVTRALIEEPGSRGQEYTINEELARTVSGFTPIVINTRTDFRFQGGEYLPLRSAAKGSANREIKRADATVEETVAGWEKYLDELYNVQSGLFYKVQAARAMGTSDDVIRRELKQAGLGTAEMATIMRGEFYPGLAAKETIKEVMMEMRNEDKTYLVEERPWEEYNRLSNERRGMPLAPEQAKAERDARLESRRQDRQREADQAVSGVLTENPPMVTPQPEITQEQMQEVVAPEQTPSVQGPSLINRAVSGAERLGSGIIQRAQAIAPSLLGGDPASQAANAEIARRSQGQ